MPRWMTSFGGVGRSEVVDVMFRMWRGEVIALFPGLMDSPGHCQSYQHVGQHGGADCGGIIRRSRPAEPQEYAALKRELESEPFEYKLRVVQRRSKSGFASVDDEPEVEEGDITTEDHTRWYQYDKLYFTGDEKGLLKKMNKDKFWPNVWFISDHGNAHLVTL